MTAPPLKVLYKRELLVAPKLAFAMLGCADLHTCIAERLRDKIKLTSSVPEITDFPKLFGLPSASEEDPLAGQSVAGEAVDEKKYLRADLFSYFQRSKPGVCLALVSMSALTSGVTPWRACIQDLQALHKHLESQSIRLVVGVVNQGTIPEASKMEEFASVLSRDMFLDPRQLQQLDSSPTTSQLDELNLALQLYSEKACTQWQDTVYHRCQQISMQDGALTHLIRHSIKAAHFFELTHAWQSARARYGEAYKQLQAAMVSARTVCEPQDIRQLCMAADWVHLKLLLYAIGSGAIRPENVRSLHAQWRAHIRSFGAPLSGAHCALKSWHAEWLGRQHHALLAVMKMYCHTITTSHLTPELQAHMLLEGALAAAAERQRLSSAVRESELGVVLDTSSVEEGAWLGSLMQTSPTARYLNGAETLAYLAWSESAVDHPSVMIALLDDCLMELPKMQGRLLSGMEVEAAQVALAAEAQGLSPTSTDGSSPSISRKKTSHRRRYLSLIAQKGAQMMLLLQTRSPDAPPLPQGWLGDAWALLAAAAVQFRREGWHTLLAHTLEHSRECARLLRAAAALVICSLELSVVGRSLHPTQRTALCRKALQACTSADPHAHALADAPAATGDDADAEKALAERNLNFQVQWTNMSSGPPDRSGGSSVIDHGWLNVLNLSVACAETGFTAGDVVVAVAMRNMLPEASTCSGDGGQDKEDTNIPLAKVSITVASDLGYLTLDARPLDAKRGWLQCLGSGRTLEDATTDSPYQATEKAPRGSDSSTAQVDGGWRPHSARAGDFASSGSSSSGKSLPPLRPGEWTIFAARVQAAPAASVRMHEVSIALGPATSVSFVVGQLCHATSQTPRTSEEASGTSPRAPEPVEAPPHIICGAPALGLQSGLVGRDAPFGCHPFPSGPSAQADDSAASALPEAAAEEASGPRLPPLHLRAGVYSVELQHALPPASLQATGVPVSLAMGECATGTLVVAPHRTVSKGTPVWLQIVPKSAAQDTKLTGEDSLVEIEENPLACRVFVGSDHESALEVVPNERTLLPLPALAMGWPYVLRVWVVGVGVGGVALEGGLDWLGTTGARATKSADVAMRCEIDVLEPFVFQAKFTATDGRAVALQADSEPGTVHVHRVPAASHCNMSLRVASLTPYTLQLQSLQLEGLAAGWSLLHNSGQELQTAPHTMHCDDVYTSAFSLRSPETPGTVQLGSLRLKLYRIDSQQSDPVADQGTDEGEEGSGSADTRNVPAAARAAMLEERTLVHALPRIAVCPRVVEAWFETFPTATVGWGVPVKIKLGNCSDRQLSLRVFLGTGGLGSVAGEPFKDVWLGAHEAGEARWDVSTQAAGVMSFLGKVQVTITPESVDEATVGGGGGASRPVSKGGEQPQLEFSLVASVYVT